jgi:prepilin-type N-terminal cleavage/methylation domain-containing protein
MKGFTLIELLIAVAILAIVAAIGIPAYNGYIATARVGAAQENADSLRVFLEDYYLDNGTYKAGGASSFNKAQLQTNFGWSPDGDHGEYTYAVTARTNSWDIVVTHTPSGSWLRCENRMSKCCSNNDSGASKTACP